MWVEFQNNIGVGSKIIQNYKKLIWFWVIGEIQLASFDLVFNFLTSFNFILAGIRLPSFPVLWNVIEIKDGEGIRETM